MKRFFLIFFMFSALIHTSAVADELSPPHLRTACLETLEQNFNKCLYLGVSSDELLGQASQNGDLEAVEFLIHNGDVDINSMVFGRSTAVSWASFKGHIDVVKLLINAGADINIPDFRGHTPLEDAVRKNHVDVATLLLESGASQDLSTKHLFQAIKFGHLGMISFLLEQGVDIHSTDELGHSVLHYVLSHKTHLQDDLKYKTFVFLIENGAEVNAVTSSGLSVLQNAVQGGKIEIAALLIDNGAALPANLSRLLSDRGSSWEELMSFMK